uniref:Uncharacterized protein n=1 Tax=Kalanchoe fedtschenkoi TaxID=63787 RepID=A0A7N0U643_KALFE
MASSTSSSSSPLWAVLILVAPARMASAAYSNMNDHLEVAWGDGSYKEDGSRQTGPKHHSQPATRTTMPMLVSPPLPCHHPAKAQMVTPPRHLG